MRRVAVVLGMLAATATMTACRSAPPIARRARQELRCASVLLDRTGPNEWTAMGCGRTATFVCSRGFCVLEQGAAVATEQPAIELATYRCITMASHPNRALTACDLMRSIESRFLACAVTRVVIAYGPSGVPRPLGDASTCAMNIVRELPPEPELADVVVRLQRRP